MRFPVVLFDLDGTVVDSGGIILASMRHATRSVLGRDIPDELLMAAVGGPGLEAQMRAFGGEEHVDELVRVYRAHNEPLHDSLELCFGMDDVLLRLSEEGRRLGLVSAKRRSTVELAFAATEIGHLFEVVVGGDEAPRGKPEPDTLLLALERLGADPAEAAYARRSPSRASRTPSASAATGASSPAPTPGVPIRRGGRPAAATAHRTSSRWCAPRAAPSGSPSRPRCR